MTLRKALGVFFIIASLISTAAWLWQTRFSNSSNEAFLEQHWSRPIPSQGEPPAGFSPLEASLDPKSCAQCHQDKFEEWQGSLHSHTMGPGIRWQLQIADVATAKSCLGCHAPMTEQLALFSQERGWSRTAARPPDYVPADLHSQGLVCAACHVRAHTRYGPPPNKPVRDEIAHGGFTVHAAFGDSRFCASCHQFAEDGPRLNGKLREDTYNQWLQTRFSREGKSCQSCHMPERQHLWKGIHDPQMTRSALSVRLDAEQDAQGRLRAKAEVVNTGAGHHFPTYLVPEVLLHLEHVDASGKVVELASHTLAWRANLALSEELFDQRLQAGASVVLEGEAAAVGAGGSVRLRVSVAPRQQYRRTFEDYLLRYGERLKPETANLVEQAVVEAQEAEYEFVAAEQQLAVVAN